MLPDAQQRLFLVACLALAPCLAGAQAGPQTDPPIAPSIAPSMAPHLASKPLHPVDGAMDPAGAALQAPAMPMAASPLRNVRKLSDSDLSCAQIHAETQALEQLAQQQQAEALQVQQAMTEAQNEMMKQATEGRGMGGVGASIGSGLLGFIPGASQVQGYAMQAAASARQASMQDSVNRMMQASTQMVQTGQALEQTQARSDHLTDLFLKKGCKLSEMKAAAGAAN